MRKWCPVFVCALIIGCAGVSERSDLEANVAVSGTLRTITITLVNDAPESFITGLQNKKVLVEPISTAQRKYGEERYIEDGIQYVRIVDSCEGLSDKDGRRCRPKVSSDKVYGAVTASGLSGPNGSVQLQLPAGAYRLRLATMPTIEDSKCNWGGSVEIDSQTNSASLPLLVYCESG